MAVPSAAKRQRWAIGAALVGTLVACGDSAKLPLAAGVGDNPSLPEPQSTLIPTVKIAKAIGWPAGQGPSAMVGTKVVAFASQLDHPRWLFVLPNGDVLVAESNAPKSNKAKGVKAYFMKKAMQKAGAGVPSADRISLLRDADGDGVAEVRHVFIDQLHSPFGMALIGDRLFVANTDAVVWFPYTSGISQMTEPATHLVDLPAGPINHHWTKNLIASPDGRALYATVGSNSNVGENGVAAEEGRAAVWLINVNDGTKRLFASGLRNPNGLAFEPSSGQLWTTVNERDEIGSDLVPDYMTSLKDGGFYGWPYSYFGDHVDVRVQPPRADLVATALVPDYALGAHTASLGLAFSDQPGLPQQLRGGMFVGQHGSWNRKPPSGYQVVFVRFAGSKPTGQPIQVLGGFLSAAGEAYGRPVGVAIDRRGALLVADDVGNTIWRVSAAD